MLASSRFAHYIKVIMRDKVGSFQTRQSVETYLNTWISDYVCLNDSAPQETKARLPLGNARIDVSEILETRLYKAVVFIRASFSDGRTYSINKVGC